jgi:hypothetical protein
LPRRWRTAPSLSCTSAWAAQASAGQALAQLRGWNVPGLASAHHKRQPRTRFYDNLDPVTLTAVLGSNDLGGMRFVAISKSRTTPKKLVQALAALARRAREGAAASGPCSRHTAVPCSTIIPGLAAAIRP